MPSEEKGSKMSHIKHMQKKSWLGNKDAKKKELDPKYGLLSIRNTE